MTVGTVDDEKLEKIAKAMAIASNYAKRLFKKVLQSLFTYLFDRMVKSLNDFVENHKSSGKIISFHKNCQDFKSIKRNIKTDIIYAAVNYFALGVLKDIICSKQAQKVIDWVLKLCDTYQKDRDFYCVYNVFRVDAKEPSGGY